MEVAFDVNELEGMKRAELQKLCKSVGIKANMKNGQLIDALRKHAAQFSRKRKRSSVAEKTQNTSSCTVVNEEEKTDKQPVVDDNDSYKKQLMDQLDKKVEEKMPTECKIPRFVQFANKVKSAQETNKTPATKWSKIHNSQFEKMDSIDVYLEKKRKRVEMFNQSAKRAKSIGVSRKSGGKASVDASFKPSATTLDKSKAFVFGSPAAKPFFQPSDQKVTNETASTASRKILKLKSPKIFKPFSPSSAMASTKPPKTPNTRKTISVATALENKPKTPANSARKSTGVTPFRFLPANVPATPTPTPKKKFDLKASLAKPLPYKPHTGKLKPLSTYKEECRPTLTEAKLKSHRVDVKSTKVTSREQRRMKENKSRESRKANALSRRRGLAC